MGIRLPEVRVGKDVDAEDINRAMAEHRAAVQKALDTIGGSASLFAGAKVIEGVKLSSLADAVVSHGLGRKVRWVVVDKSQKADVWRSPAKPIDALNTILLRTDFVVSALTGLFTVDVLVF